MLERADETVRLSDYPRRHVQASMSPFRYPGGKGFLTGYLSKCLDHLDRSGRVYVEPFCGGAGAAINLLDDQSVDEVHLNDLDIRVYSAWKAMLTENERFLVRLASVEVTLDNWNYCRNLVNSGKREYDFELGFATFFINRTSRAGIITGSGPIGGYEQKSQWGIDARFYRETMMRRISWLGDYADRIKLTNSPAVQFLADHGRTHDRSRTFYFVDPPYVVAGSRLYLDAMDFQSHRALSEILKGWSGNNWLLTYDDDPFVRRLYNSCRTKLLEVNYSLRNTRRAREVLIAAS